MGFQLSIYNLDAFASITHLEDLMNSKGINKNEALKTRLFGYNPDDDIEDLEEDDEWDDEYEDDLDDGE